MAGGARAHPEAGPAAGVGRGSRVPGAGCLCSGAGPVESGTGVVDHDGQRGRWSRALQRNPASVERATDALVSAGIERERIEVLPGIVHGTIAEARAFRLYAEAHNVRSALVVTSPYHSRRAVWTIRRVVRGTPVQVGIAPVPMASTSSHPSTWWNTSMGWRNVTPEFVKMPYYWLAY